MYKCHSILKLIESGNNLNIDLAKLLIKGFYKNNNFEHIKELNNIFIEKEIDFNSQIHLSPHFKEFENYIHELNKIHQ